MEEPFSNVSKHCANGFGDSEVQREYHILESGGLEYEFQLDFHAAGHYWENWPLSSSAVNGNVNTGEEHSKESDV